VLFFFSSRRRHTRFSRDWSSDVCSSDLALATWARDAKSDVKEKVLGHGFGASRIGAASIGDVARRFYPYRITPSAAASMLWDIEIGRASCRERGEIAVCAVSYNNT